MATVQAVASQDDEKQGEERARKLYTLGLALAQKRSDAIQARKQSGIEDEWAQDEEFYQGIDEANRKESNDWRSRPAGQKSADAAGSTRSTVFVNITGPYVDTAAASMSDMLLPIDDRGWAIAPPPIPDLAALALGKVPKAMLEAVGELYPLPDPLPPGTTPAPPPAAPTAPGAPPAATTPPPPVPGSQTAIAQSVQDIFQQRGDWVQQQVAKAGEIMELAKATAAKAERRIENWHIECQFHREVRDSIHDAARIGTAVLKGPIPFKQRGVAWVDNALIIKEKIQPGSKRISPWNLYPDGACGENIHNGSHIFEEDELSERQLTELIGMPGYIESEILQCLKEGPTKAIPNPKREENGYSKKEINSKYQIWYFHGYLTKDDMQAAECHLSEDAPMRLPAVIVMVNDRVIRASLNPLDTGDFPYDVMPWAKRAGHWAGRGTGRQMRTQQKQVNAGWRALMDNAGIASGPMLVFRQGLVTPHDGVAELRPRKIWLLSEDADARIDAEKAIGVIKVDMMVNELMVIITEAMKLAEVVTGLPALQPQQNTQPETLGAMQIRNNASSVVRRRIARLFDDYITEPHVRRYYLWLMQYGEDDSEKGDFIIDARGSSALVQRDLQSQSLTAMMAKPLDPRMKVDPARLFAEWSKSQYIDPKKIQYTDDEWAKLPAPPPPVEIEVANIRAKGAIDAATATGQAWVAREQAVGNWRTGMQQASDQAEGDRSVAEAHLAMNDQAFQAQQNDKNRQLEMLALHSNEYIEQMKQSGASAETLQQLRAMLAATTMKLQTELKLNAAANAQANDHETAKHLVTLHQHHNPQPMQPPVQAPGRAGNGHAFDQAPA